MGGARSGGSATGPLNNPRHELYAQGLAAGLEQLVAYERAGYKPNAGSASTLAKNPKVRARRDELLQLAADEAIVSAESVLLELKRIGFSNIAHYVSYSQGGVALRDSATLDEDAHRAIAEVSETLTDSSRSLKFKLHDKLKALEMLGRHLGVFAADNKQQSDRGSGVIIMYPSNGRDEER